MRMLARVEGMPLEALEAGVPWSWHTTAEYLDELEGNVGVNVGVMVGHSAIRRLVMGAEATERTATDDEIAAMSALLRDGLDAGGMGFSSSWARTHNDADGHMVPSRYAANTELVELARVIGEFEGTSLEFLPMIGAFEPWAKDLMSDMSVAAQRPLNWNALFVNEATMGTVDNQLSASDLARSAWWEGRGPHGAEATGPSVLVRVRLRARRAGRLGNADGPATVVQACDSR